MGDLCEPNRPRGFCRHRCCQRAHLTKMLTIGMVKKAPSSCNKEGHSMSPFQIEALPGVPTPEEVSHRLLFANSAGLFLTVFTGASFMPWMWEVIRWVVSHLPFLHPRPVPSLLNALVHPNWTMGIIWLGYYLFSYGWACLATPPSAPIADKK